MKLNNTKKDQRFARKRTKYNNVTISFNKL